MEETLDLHRRSQENQLPTHICEFVNSTEHQRQPGRIPSPSSPTGSFVLILCFILADIRIAIRSAVCSEKTVSTSFFVPTIPKMSEESGKSMLEVLKSPQKNDLSSLKRLRGTLKGRITLLQKILVKFEVGSPTPLQISELKVRLQSAQDTFKEFNSVQSKIEVLVDEQELDDQLEHRDKFESSYFSTIALITEFIKPTKETDGSESVAHNDKSTLNIKLPDIKLPSFDGSYDHWLEFKNSYFSLIHKRTDLDFIQKIHYLKSSVSGSALQVISALEFTGSNYVHAWELLENRFHNERLLVHNHVKALFNVPSISKESPQQLRILIDTILRNLRALKSLNEPVDNWDTLIIYLIVSKLDVSTERA